jgi:hypothetical protein
MAFIALACARPHASVPASTLSPSDYLSPRCKPNKGRAQQ